ncbi:acyl carrier protein [Actinoplanes sp. NPDC049599]|uniref:acyl carrier protein n=1 Tax=Actinoplanes sp. NPDC049599 TaxID=3363903 RepID=UPI00378D6855
MTTDRSSTGRRVIDLWQGVLGIDDIQPDDDFFDLGGNSITAIRMLPLVSETFGVEVDVMFIFDNPTPAEFGEALSGMLADA